MQNIVLTLNNNNRERELTYSIEDKHFEIVTGLRNKIKDDNKVIDFIKEHGLGNLVDLKFKSIETAATLLILENVGSDFKILFNEANGKLSLPSVITNSFTDTEMLFRTKSYLEKNLLNENIKIEEIKHFDNIYSGKDKYGENYDSRGVVDSKLVFLSVDNKYEDEHNLRSIKINKENLVNKIDSLLLTNERDRDMLKHNIDFICSKMSVKEINKEINFELSVG